MPFCVGQKVRCKSDGEEYAIAKSYPIWLVIIGLEEVFWSANDFEAIPMHLNPRWLTSSVVALAQAIQEERAWDKLPILADALEEAGCDDESTLTHFREHWQAHIDAKTDCGVLGQLFGLYTEWAQCESSQKASA